MAEHIDASDVHQLHEVLVRAAGVAPKEARKVVGKGALQIKNDARRRIAGHRSAPAYPYAIGYDTHETMTGAWAEIGPDKDKRQGALGNILEFGTVKNPPIPHMRPAADAEEPKFAKAMEALAVKVTDLG